MPEPGRWGTVPGVKWLYAWVVLAVSFLITAAVFPGIHVDWSPGEYLILAAVFAVVNLSLGTILRLLSLPVMFITLGLFALVINTGLLIVTAWLMDDLAVDNIGAAFGGALVLSVVRSILGYFVDHVRK
jgi:putative membrane protein